MTVTRNQDPLTVASIFERAGALFPDVEIVSRRPDNSMHRYTYSMWYRRTRMLAAALQGYGLQAGERVATLMWNHYAHLEAYFAVPIVGGVLHSLHLRLHPDELADIINDAGDRFLLVDDVLLPLFERIKDRVNIERVIVVPFSGQRMAHVYEDYEAVLEQANGEPVYAEVDEHEPAGICYTSGLTGKPKSVIYSHRAIALRSYSISLPDNFSISRADTILPAMSMFHADAWGMPYAGVMNGSKLVFPGPNLRPHAVLDLLSSEEVTLTEAVPTVWLAVINALERQPERWRLARNLRIVAAGPACPVSLFGRFEEFEVQVIRPWGMIQAGATTGFSARKNNTALSGEVDIENALVTHPAVAEAAVITVPHPKWQERPLAIVVLKEEADVTKDELRSFLGGNVAQAQVPDDFVFVSELPHNSTGQLLKSELCKTYREC